MSQINSVLWLNDDPNTISNFLKIFKEKGISVDIAITSSEALKFLETKEYDIIISNMANVDSGGYHLIAGLLFLQKVKDELDISTPFVIFCSKDEVSENRDVAMELGAKAIISSSEKLMKVLGLD